MSHQDAIMLILHHHHTVVRAPRVVTMSTTLRRRGDGEQLLKHLVLTWQIQTNVINPSFDRRLGNRNQEQGGKEQRNVPETDPAHDREVAGQPDHTVAHMLGGRDALDCRGEIYPLVMVIHIGTLRDDESVGHRIVEWRQFLHIDVVGGLAPTDLGLRPQFIVKVVLAQIKLDNRRAVFNRRADKGILIHLRDSRRKLHLHGHRHVTSLCHRRCAMGYVAERIATNGNHGQTASYTCQE